MNHSHGEDKTLSSVAYSDHESLAIPETLQLSQPRQLWNGTGPSSVLPSSAWVANYSHGEDRSLVWT